MLELKVITTAISALFTTTKGLFYVFFAVLILFILVSASCHPKPPVVEVKPTPPVSGAQINKVAESLDQTINDNKKAEEATNNVVEQSKEKVHTKVNTIKNDPIKKPEVKEREIAQAQMDSLDEIYYSYYPKPVSNAPPATI